MGTLPECPQCRSEFTCEDGANYVCPECAHEWLQVAAASADEKSSIHDSKGNVLQNGDTVTVIKDLKIQGLVVGGKDRHQGQEHLAWSTAITTSTARLTASARCP